MPRAALTTTSYAILGWLDVSPWTTYELAKMMQANLAFFWPRAASRLYEEPKNLVAHGLATLERSHTGKRPRTVYKITDVGRQELRVWQATKSAPPTLDFEALVHLYFGASATPGQLLASLDSVKARADDMFRQGTAIEAAYTGGTHPFPERAPYSRFIFDFLWSFAELLRDWSDRSAAELTAWQDTAPSPDKQARALALMRECIERYELYEATQRAAPWSPTQR
jgi:PadR family transcriptional regulator AphA